MDKIILPEIAFSACHGVYDEEKRMPQPFVIRVELGLDLCPAAISGRVEDTVHYGELYADILRLATGQQFELIESLAYRAAELALERPLVQWAQVRVEKSQARHEGQCFCAQVQVELTK